jgi:transcriptional regulator with GAF, ATPase, and Fis domain
LSFLPAIFAVETRFQMEERLVIFLASNWLARPVIDEINRLLQTTGVSLSMDREEACGIAAVCLCDQPEAGDIYETIGELTQKDYRIIVINWKKGLSDAEKWNLIKAGAGDIIDWYKKESFAVLLHARVRRWDMIENLMDTAEIKDKIIGNSREWKRFLRKIVEVAFFTGCNILLTGASGTGKELTANLIHSIDQRRNKGRMVLMDCTTLSPELSGSEFYGHEKGAFTNAVESRDGAFALADKGTIFLDELGELPLSLQAGLLRVIQEGSYKRLGSNIWRQTKFRLISATHRDLQREIQNGQFREDLYFRVAGAVFTLPTLEERREDIPELARFFLREELKVVKAPDIDPIVLDHLLARSYPGNIRELKQLMSRILMRYTGEDRITVGDVPDEEMGVVGAGAPRGDLRRGMEEFLRLAIAGGRDLASIKNEVISLATEIALLECDGSMKLAARRLNVEVRTLQYIRKRSHPV